MRVLIIINTVHFNADCHIIRLFHSSNIDFLLSFSGINPGERGLKLLLVLSSVFPWHFLDADVLRQIIGLLSISNPDPTVAPLALAVLTYVGKHQPLGDAFPDLMATMVSE